MHDAAGGGGEFGHHGVLGDKETISELGADTARHGGIGQRCCPLAMPSVVGAGGAAVVASRGGREAHRSASTSPESFLVGLPKNSFGKRFRHERTSPNQKHAGKVSDRFRNRTRERTSDAQLRGFGPAYTSFGRPRVKNRTLPGRVESSRRVCEQRERESGTRRQVLHQRRRHRQTGLETRLAARQDSDSTRHPWLDASRHWGHVTCHFSILRLFQYSSSTSAPRSRLTHPKHILILFFTHHNHKQPP
mmetsp:Transcript_6879/g.19295  ORF Transcript_6879/g.19295 Transcript_6879/m.19295 type:complete len:248 (+) Transcript_6879:834-1577(+)